MAFQPSRKGRLNNVFFALRRYQKQVATLRHSSPSAPPTLFGLSTSASSSSSSLTTPSVSLSTSGSNTSTGPLLSPTSSSSTASASSVPGLHSSTSSSFLSLLSTTHGSSSNNLTISGGSVASSGVGGALAMSEAVTFDTDCVFTQVWKNSITGADQCLARGSSVAEGTSIFGDTALHFAVLLLHLDFVDFLLARSAPVSVRNVFGQTPLHLAAMMGTVAVCKKLLEAGADVDEADEFGRTPLFYAVDSARLVAVEYLISEGASLTSRDKNRLTPWHIAAMCCNRRQEALLTTLGKYGAAEAEPGDTKTPLMLAAFVGTTQAVRFFLQDKAPSNEEQSRALRFAVSGGHLSVLELFASLRPDLLKENAAMVFLRAVETNHVDIATWIWNRSSSDMKLSTEEASSALLNAVVFDMHGIVNKLLDVGADVNFVDADGMTPFLAAAAHGRLNLMHLLIENGASIRSRDARDYGALDHACANDNMDMIEVLLDFGHNPNHHNKNGESPLMVAVGQANENAMRVILAHIGRRPPRDPLGDLKMWPKGPFLQVVVELKLDEFIESKVFNRGNDVNSIMSFGTYMGMNVVAHKFLPPIDMRELAFHLSLTCHLRHPNLNTLLGVFSDGVTYTLLFESPGNAPVLFLDNVCHSCPDLLDADTIVVLARKLLSGLVEMIREGAGKPPILHRGLQTSCIWLSQKNGPILSAFRNGCHGADGKQLQFSGRIGVVGWTPPEILKGLSYDEKVDVFGFACVLFEMREGRFPFSDVPIFEVPRKILVGDRPKLTPAKSPSDAFIVSVIEKCWQQDPSNRPTIHELFRMFDDRLTTTIAGDGQERLDRLCHAAMDRYSSVPVMPRIRMVGAVPLTQVSLLALSHSSDEQAQNTRGPQRVTLYKMLVDGNEYFARFIPLVNIHRRRLQLFQLRMSDVEGLARSRHRGANHVLRVLFNDVDEMRVRLFTQRYDYVLMDRIRHMAIDRKCHWSPEEVRNMALQIALGMSFLCESDPPIHHCISDRDIFLIEERGNVRVMVGGFGLSQLLLTAKFSDEILGDPGFVDPTLLMSPSHLFNTVTDRNHQLSCEASDVFSFGMVLRSMLGLRRPFEGEASPNDCIRQGVPVDPILLSAGYKQLQELSASCINPLRSHRPTFGEIIDRLERMRDLPTVGDKLRPKRSKSKLSFMHPAVSAMAEEEGFSFETPPISLPVSLMQPSSKLLLKSAAFRLECGAFLASSQSGQNAKRFVLDEDSSFDDYNSVLCNLPHACLIGGGASRQVLVIVSKVKGMYNDEPVYRALIRTTAGDERCYIPASTKALLPRKGQEGTPPTSLQLLKALSIVSTKFEKYSFKVLSESVNKAESVVLSEFEHACCRRSITIGVIYAKAGQASLMDMLGNETSHDFDSFLSMMGDTVKLNQFSRFAGGLDTKYDSCGRYSVYTRFSSLEVMFHVATMIPADLDDHRSQRLRMNFLSRNACLIVFQDEGSPPLSPDIFDDCKNVHVIAVVRPVSVKSPTSTSTQTLESSFEQKKDRFNKMYYQIAVAARSKVKPFNPFLENPIFEKGHFCRMWLLTKLINGERAALESDTILRARREAQRSEFLGLVESKLWRPN